MTAVPPALPGTAQNKGLKESHELTRLLLGKADMRVVRSNWRRANAGHVSLGQLQVMSAIEQCRSAALGPVDQHPDLRSAAAQPYGDGQDLDFVVGHAR
jgi:hypothetical protein